MASPVDCLEEILFCQVCFEEFKEDGDHVPRLLPCSHTLCHTCIGQLIQGNKIECPECRQKHEAKKEEKSFPQNKYIIVQIKRRSPALQKDQTQSEQCLEHGKELNIFCKDAGCQKTICVACSSSYHQKHNFVGIEERKKEVIGVLQRNIKAAITNLQTKVAKVAAARVTVAKKMNLIQLKIKKEEMTKQYDRMIKEAEDQIEIINVKTDQDLDAMNENLNLLKDISKNTKATKENSYSDLMNKLDTVRGITENVNKNLTGTRTFQYTSNIKTKAVKKRITIEINEEIVEEGLRTNLASQDRSKQCAEEQIKPVTLCENQNTTSEIQMNSTMINNILALSDGTVAVSVTFGVASSEVRRYELKTGQILSCVKTKETQMSVCSMAEVEFGGKSSLVLTDGFSLVFHDPDNLQTIFYNHQLGPDYTNILSTVPPSTLLFEELPNPYIRELDCSGSTPKRRGSITAFDSEIYDMSCVNHQNQRVLVVVAFKGMEALDVETGKSKWIQEDDYFTLINFKPFRITADRHGHLFVFDAGNRCVQMFSVSDGQYLGSLIKEGEQGLGRLSHMCFISSRSQLVVCHSKDNNAFISVLNVQ